MKTSKDNNKVECVKCPPSHKVMLYKWELKQHINNEHEFPAKYKQFKCHLAYLPLWQRRIIYKSGYMPIVTPSHSKFTIDAIYYIVSFDPIIYDNYILDNDIPGRIAIIETQSIPRIVTNTCVWVPEWAIAAVKAYRTNGGFAELLLTEYLDRISAGAYY
jgi:hypothetical protein